MVSGKVDFDASHKCSTKKSFSGLSTIGIICATESGGFLICTPHHKSSAPSAPSMSFPERPRDLTTEQWVQEFQYGYWLAWLPLCFDTATAIQIHGQHLGTNAVHRLQHSEKSALPRNFGRHMAYMPNSLERFKNLSKYASFTLMISDSCQWLMWLVRACQPCQRPSNEHKLPGDS